jgi:corrinoid protein of di/trimethylamine methyltransferase
MGEGLFEAMRRSIIDGEEEVAERLALQAMAEGVAPLEAIERGFVPGVNEVGRAFGCQEMFLPDLVRAGVAMKHALRALQPAMVKAGTERPPAGRVVIGTVKGDIHEIGKNLVGTMLVANGFEVTDLGVDVPSETFVARAREVGANLVGLSALLTTTMPGQQEVIRKLQEAGLRPRVKVIVGGAPVTREWVKEIGADGFSEDALGAVRVASELVGAACASRR